MGKEERRKKKEERRNRRKQLHLEDVENSKTLEDCIDDLTTKCLFSYHYLDSNQSKSLNELGEKQRKELEAHLKIFSGESIEYWSKTPVGSGKRCYFVNYGNYDFSKSKFQRPMDVPYGVEWGRFRLKGKFRLAGFILPEAFIKKYPQFNSDTFYIVFIDPNHDFYPVN